LSVIGFFVWLGIDNISGNKGGDGNEDISIRNPKDNDSSLNGR